MLVHPLHLAGTPTAPRWYTHRTVNGVDQHGTICTAVEVGSDGTISLMASRITLGGEGSVYVGGGVGVFECTYHSQLDSRSIHSDYLGFLLP